MEKQPSIQGFETTNGRNEKQNPFIMQLLEREGEVNLTDEEHETLKAFFRLYMKADNMEREHIYFRGHADGFAYLKKIGAFKTE